MNRNLGRVSAVLNVVLFSWGSCLCPLTNVCFLRASLERPFSYLMPWSGFPENSNLGHPLQPQLRVLWWDDIGRMTPWPSKTSMRGCCLHSQRKTGATWKSVCVFAQARPPGISSGLALKVLVFLLWKNQKLSKGAENKSQLRIICRTGGFFLWCWWTG